MPSFVASIEVHFNADTPEDADRAADFFSDLIADDPRSQGVTAITTGCAPDDSPEAS